MVAAASNAIYGANEGFSTKALRRPALEGEKNTPHTAGDYKITTRCCGPPGANSTKICSFKWTSLVIARASKSASIPAHVVRFGRA